MVSPMDMHAKHARTPIVPSANIVLDTAKEYTIITPVLHVCMIVAMVSTEKVALE